MVKPAPIPTECSYGQGAAHVSADQMSTSGYGHWIQAGPLEMSQLATLSRAAPIPGMTAVRSMRRAREAEELAASRKSRKGREAEDLVASRKGREAEELATPPAATMLPPPSPSRTGQTAPDNAPPSTQPTAAGPPADVPLVVGDIAMLRDSAVAAYRADGYNFDSEEDVLQPGQAGEVVKVYEDDGNMWETIACPEAGTDRMRYGD